MLWTYVKVFLVGGALCAVGEALILKTKLTPARILVAYILAGVALSALGLYEPLVRFAAAGATVFVAGSAVFGSEDPNGMVNALAALARASSCREEEAWI